MRYQHFNRRMRRRGAALYIAVLSTALIVSLLGLAGLTVVRIERRQAAGASELLVARANARSAVELALVQLSGSTDWRGTVAHGSESGLISLGTSTSTFGTLSWVLTDSDGSFSDMDTQLRLHGVGRVGDTVQVASLEINLAKDGEVHNQTDTSSTSEDDLTASQWWCQYFKPSLPSDVLGWRITAVDLLCARDEKEDFDIRLYEPDPGNTPSDTLLDSVTLNAKVAEKTMLWHTFDFPGEHVFAAGDDVCLALTTTAGPTPLRLTYADSGITDANSALIRGTPAWAAAESGKALLYRIHGVYLMEYGEVNAVLGTWLWEAAP